MEIFQYSSGGSSGHSSAEQDPKPAPPPSPPKPSKPETAPVKPETAPVKPETAPVKPETDNYGSTNYDEYDYENTNNVDYNEEDAEYVVPDYEEENYDYKQETEENYDYEPDYEAVPDLPVADYEDYETALRSGSNEGSKGQSAAPLPLTDTQGCPGGDLDTCIDVCPGFNKVAFGLCVAECGQRCP